MKAQFRLATPRGAGAIAVIELFGADVVPLLHKLTGDDDWPIGRVRLVDLANVDRGIALRLSERYAQLMPHGGPRVVQLLREALESFGATIETQPDPVEVYPEAESRDEALVLATLARATSPAAIDRLLGQPRRWRAWREARDESLDSIRARSTLLNRLLTPPMVVLVGAPNIGKSTLTNALAGRSVSITADAPGVTRDYVGVSLDLRGLTVTWYDTPGRRTGGDAIEREAIALSEGLLASADLVIAAVDGQAGWPALADRPADLRVVLQGDRPEAAQRGTEADLTVSAHTGAGLAELTRRIHDRLIPRAAQEAPGPWLFDERIETRGADSFS